MAAEVAPLISTDPSASPAQIAGGSPGTAAPTLAPPPPLTEPGDPSSPQATTTQTQTQTNPLDRSDQTTDSEQAASAQLSPQDAMDFLLHPTEIARGLKAAENYLNACRNEETRRFAQEALETLATVISGGHCDGLEFPWQQVRPYHGAAALTILKEKGAPGRIEALRCRRDTTRSYHVVPENYSPGQVQKIRTTLTKVIKECSELGFVVTEEDAAAPSPESKSKPTTAKKTKAAARGRLLGDGELRALSAASSSSANAEGKRDAVFFTLVNSGLKITEITALTIDSVRFNNKTGTCNIVSTPATKGGRSRRFDLTNDQLICLEDWLDSRGDADGPLLCTLGRGGKVEGKRLTTALLKELCEKRGKQAEVVAFVPNDLSRSAEALTQHRKAVKKRAAKQSQLASTSSTEMILFESGRADSDSASDSEAIRFPFLGLGL